MALPPGKLPPELLRDLLSRSNRSDPRVLIGPRVGVDAAAIDMGENVLVVKSDPITFATRDAGWYLVNVNANDIACMGALPKWLLVTALLPENGTTPELVSKLFNSIILAADEVGVSLIGGHTEITLGVDRPILIGTMLGEVPHHQLVDPSKVCPGDAILLCKGIAIEGTALLAREAAAQLAARVSCDVLDNAERFLTSPGVSVVPAARALMNSGADIHAMHDPTEGGIASALRELGMAAGLSSSINLDRILVYPESLAICYALDIDVLGLIASGALLAVVPEQDVDAAIHSVTSGGLPCARIGTFTDAGNEVIAQRGEDIVELPAFDVDEIARYFASRA